MRGAVLIAMAVLMLSAAAHAAVQNADTLLATLAKAKSPEDARAIEEQIERLWSHSGSPSADLLFRRGQDALGGDDLANADKIFKALTRVAPNFAEGWHARAATDLQANDYEDALVSLRHTLQLEPRNFNAMIELAGVFEEFNDKAHALAAYRRALQLNPYAQGAKDRVRELERDVEGQKI
jgi:tetratricopeptide (TPR) repeat protein